MLKKLILIISPLFLNKTYSAEISLYDFYYKLNSTRVNYGLLPCSENAYMQRAALDHATDMQTHNFFSHRGSDGSTYIDRVKRTGAKFNPSGEIIAKGGAGPKAIDNIIKAWINSPGHKAILLDPDNIYCGANFKLKDSQYPGNYWVVVFSKKI